MRPTFVLPALALVLSCGLAPTRGHAMPGHQAPGQAARGSGAIVDVANARNPYGNVDRRDDAGNDTGDSQVDRLNSMQLNQNYRGPTYYVGQQPPAAAAPMGGPAPASPMAPRPPGY